jgi:hypothetical protein
LCFKAIARKYFFLLGKGGSLFLSQIELDEGSNTVGDRIHSLSHKDSYKTQSNKMSELKNNYFEKY